MRQSATHFSVYENVDMLALTLKDESPESFRGADSVIFMTMAAGTSNPINYNIFFEPQQQQENAREKEGRSQIFRQLESTMDF